MKPPVNKRIILDLCGGTESWSKPYSDAGYDVRVVTLPYLPLFDTQVGDVKEYEPPDGVYGILAAPPCTMFSLARQNAKTPRNFQEGMELVAACLHIIWKCRLRDPLQFWALENPKGYLRQFLGNPPYKFQHWEFGDNGWKYTDLWGYFNSPEKTVTEIPPVATQREWNRITSVNGLNRKAVRSITPPGFVNAFFKANR